MPTDFPLEPKPLALERRLQIFGANVRRARTTRRITQTALGAGTRLCLRTIAKIEAGELKVRAETVARLRAALGCSDAELFHGCGELRNAIDTAAGAPARRPSSGR